METWRGKQQNMQAAQHAFYHRAKCNSAATLGRYSSALEGDRAGLAAAVHCSDGQDD